MNHVNQFITIMNRINLKYNKEIFFLMKNSWIEIWNGYPLSEESRMIIEGDCNEDYNLILNVLSGIEAML